MSSTELIGSTQNLFSCPSITPLVDADRDTLVAALAVVFDAAKARAFPPGGTCPPYLLDTCHQVGKKTTWVYKDDRVIRTDFRRALVKSLKDCGRDAEAEAVGSCGERFDTYRCEDCGAYPAFPTSCKHRLCPDCAARRGALLVSEHEELLKLLRYPKMLTLTFLSVPHLTRRYIRWCRGCFTKLRHRKVFAGCWGGIYSFEATYTSGVGWHLHLHAVIGSKFIDQAELSKEWQKITGAWDVDIRAIQGDDKWPAIQEVVKYPCKASTFMDNSDLVDEWLNATDGVSLAYGFGKMYRVKTKSKSSGPLLCPECGGSNLKRLGIVGRSEIKRVENGYVWVYICPGPARSPPGEGSHDGR